MLDLIFFHELHDKVREPVSRLEDFLGCLENVLADFVEGRTGRSVLDLEVLRQSHQIDEVCLVPNVGKDLLEGNIQHDSLES